MILKTQVPLHITGFFSPQLKDNPLLSGSLGAGLVLAPYLKCFCEITEKKEYSRPKLSIFYNGVKVKIKPVENLIHLLNFNKKILVKIISPAPIGVGYGVSGATTLAVSLILHRLLGKSALKAAQLAHIAEVESLTGLGDVIALFSGSDLTLRTKAGGPDIGKIKAFKQSKNLRIITADLKKRSTKKMLKSMPSSASNFALNILPQFAKNADLKNFFEYSQLFAEKMGFINKNFLEKLEPLKKYSLGFTIKKGVLFGAVKKENVKKTTLYLKKFSPAIHIFKFGKGLYEQ